MKSYNDFILNEIKALSKDKSLFKLNNNDTDLIFGVLVFDADISIKKKFIREIRDYFLIDNELEKYIIGSNSLIKIKIYETWLNKPTFSIFSGESGKFKIDFERLGYGSLSREYPTITITKFIEVGLKNIEEYFNMLKTAKKYNL